MEKNAHCVEFSKNTAWVDWLCKCNDKTLNNL